MSVKLHRCSGMWVKFGGHPCWRAQKALDEAGVDYELVLHPQFPRGKRTQLKDLTGQSKLPVVEFEDGSFLMESKTIAERAKSGTLSDRGSA
ncbi:MAG: glutathione S-transferase N-terminal domain-containing protein [Gaiellales bacterium]